jgi:glycosyltransferase involved in cell wall biosynthesis
VKILHTVEFYYPSVGGAQEVVRRLSERMVALGHEVIVATSRLAERTQRSLNGVQIVEFEVGGNAVRGFTGPDAERYKRFLVESDADVIMNYAAQQWTADLCFEVLDDVRARKVMVPCGFSALHSPSYAAYFERMPSILARYDATVYPGEFYRDIEFARAHGVTNCHIIPNGAGSDEFGEISEAEVAEFRSRYGIEGLLITTLGNHTGAKGHAESIRAFRRSRTGPATLLILGHGSASGCLARCRRSARAARLLAPLTRKRLLLLEAPREATVQALKASDVFLFLSNVEASPIVLFESAAAGVPFVASPAGNAAEIARWTGGGVIVEADVNADGTVAANVGSAAAHLTRLAADPKRRAELGGSARAVWSERFTWERIAEQYLELYARLVAAGDREYASS